MVLDKVWRVNLDVLLEVRNVFFDVIDDDKWWEIVDFIKFILVFNKLIEILLEIF